MLQTSYSLGSMTEAFVLLSGNLYGLRVPSIVDLVSAMIHSSSLLLTGLDINLTVYVCHGPQHSDVSTSARHECFLIAVSTLSGKHCGPCLADTRQVSQQVLIVRKICFAQYFCALAYQCKLMPAGCCRLSVWPFHFYTMPHQYKPYRIGHRICYENFATASVLFAVVCKLLGFRIAVEPWRHATRTPWTQFA